MITIDGVVGLLALKATEAERETVRTLALRAGLVWTCEGCKWSNSITDETCHGNMTITCTTRPVTHIGSATNVHPDGDKSRAHILAMCGDDLGPAGDFRGQYGNYLTVTSTAYATVTCQECRTAFEARRG